MSIGSDAERNTPTDLESDVIEDGTFVIYDPEAEDAWVRAGSPVALDEMA